MKLSNSTVISTDRLRAMFEAVVDGWPHRALSVCVRYSRGRDFSGTCDYGAKRILVNIGRSVRYPYDIHTYLARAKSNRRYWWKAIYRLRVADGYQLALFVFCHEYYHWLVKQARRNTRQKESMCDRYGARVLVDRYGAAVVDEKGRAVARAAWDFQDLDRFVARARRLTREEMMRVRQQSAVKAALTRRTARPAPAPVADATGQFLLFGPQR
jgi:hypothetical protein